MEKDVKQDSRQDASSEDALISKLTKLEEEIVATSKRRTQRSMVTLGGILLILFFIVLFLVNILNIAKNFDKVELAEELEKHAMLLAESDEVKELADEVQKEVVPLVRDEMVKQLKDRQQEIEDKAAASAKNLQKYLEEDVHARLVSEVGGLVEKLQKELLTKYPKIPPERMEKVLKTAQTQFIEKLSTNLENRLDRAFKDLGTLNQKLDTVKDTPKYAQLRKDDIEKIESKLIESMLELAIYNVNPERGNSPADSKEGGAK